MFFCIFDNAICIFENFNCRFENVIQFNLLIDKCCYAQCRGPYTACSVYGIR